jgi:hypothetical protein
MLTTKRKGCVHHGGQAAQLRNRLTRIHRADGGSNGSSGRARIALGTDHHSSVRGRPLEQRVIVSAFDLIARQVGIFYVLHNADDGGPGRFRSVPDVLPDGIFIRPILLGKRFIHQCHRLRSRDIVIGKDAAAAQRDLQRAEISG